MSAAADQQSHEKGLPQELWVQVRQHVPRTQRLSACALVCQKLARAAAAATQSLRLSFWDRPQHSDAFLSWASSHGHSLTKLSIAADPDYTPLRQLPCPNLLELSLSDCGVQLCAGSDHLGLLHSCTELTSLDLRDITLLDGVVTGPAGAAPARLQHLELFDDTCEGAQALVTRLFPHLPGLTCLVVAVEDSDDAELLSCFPPHTSTMDSLQQLLLSSAGPITATTLPGIERLTALQDLELTGCDLEPSCLLPMTTGLTRLWLDGVDLQPDRAQQDSALGTSQLLQLLRRCSALQKLRLGSICGDWPQQLSAYSALTASSNLQELRMYGCSVQGAAWAHVFPAGHQLPHLSWFSTGNYPDMGDAPMGCAGIARLVSCCPALKNLVFTPATEASLAPLQSLTALTSLYIRAVSPAVIRRDLTAMSQLRSLDVWVSLPAAGAGDNASSGLQHLVPLTALIGLTWLYSPALRLELSSKAPARSAPDVWAQLLEKCATDPAAQPAVISSVVRQLQQQREQVAQQGQELAAARMAATEAEAPELCGRVQALEGQQEQVATARAEAAAATAEAAELRGRVQLLEGQLQEVLVELKEQQQQRLA